MPLQGREKNQTACASKSEKRRNPSTRATAYTTVQAAASHAQAQNPLGKHLRHGNMSAGALRPRPGLAFVEAARQASGVKGRFRLVPGATIAPEQYAAGDLELDPAPPSRARDVAHHLVQGGGGGRRILAKNAIALPASASPARPARHHTRRLSHLRATAPRHC